MFDPRHVKNSHVQTNSIVKGRRIEEMIRRCHWLDMIERVVKTKM